MNKIEKYLSRLACADRDKVRCVVEKVLVRDWAGLDIKKLKGYRDIFRIRVGTHRIIFRQNKEQVRILAIDRRTEKTYEREF